MFCGTPDQVYRQIVDFIDYTGGLGNLLIMAQGGHLDHAATANQLTLMAKEVMSFAFTARANSMTLLHWRRVSTP